LHANPSRLGTVFLVIFVLYLFLWFSHLIFYFLGIKFQIFPILLSMRLSYSHLIFSLLPRSFNILLIWNWSLCFYIYIYIVYLNLITMIMRLADLLGLTWVFFLLLKKSYSIHIFLRYYFSRFNKKLIILKFLLISETVLESIK